MKPKTDLPIQEGIILVPTNRGMRVISPNRIIRVQSINSYSKLFFSDGTTLLVAKVLHYFEILLAGYPFIRVHRTHLVNIGHMHMLLMGEQPQLLLQNGEFVNISRRKRKGVLALLQNYAQQ